MNDQAALIGVIVFIALLIMGLGIYIQKTKAYNLIAGYNTRSKEEKENFDIEKYALIFRNSFLVMGILLILSYPILHFLNLDKFLSIIAISIIIIGVLYLNYMGQVYSKKGKH
ncbi:MAG: DUF3784 domain-containing protein [Cyclobacteriaceae bacterium]|jgi:hypothetical protein